jgi:hypothetical protein
MIDYGFFAHKRSADHVVLFEIKPYLMKTMGSVHIGSLVMLKPGMGSFLAAVALCTYCHVDTVKIAYTKQKLSRYTWKLFFDIKRITALRGIKFERFKMINRPLSKPTYKIFVALEMAIC